MSWKSGMKAVCIYAYCPELSRGAIYTVKVAHYCCRWWLSFDEVNDPSWTYPNCDYCGDTSSIGDHTAYEGDAFRPLLDSDNEAILDSIEEQAVEELQLVKA